MTDTALHAAIARELDEPPTVVDADHADRAGQQSAFDGLTVRDVFAAAAMVGYLAAHGGDAEIELPKRAESAKWAYLMADEMLAARRSS